MTIKAAASITINRPPADVFAVIADVPHHPDWAKGANKILNLSQQPVALGTTWTQMSRLVGRDLEAHVTVDVYEADRKFGFEVDKPFPGHMVFVMEPAGTGTRVTSSMEGEPGGFFGVAAPLVRKAIRDTMSTDLDVLKAKLEAKAQPG